MHSNFRFLYRTFITNSMSTPKDLYPEIEPFKKEFLKVSPLHEIYIEQSGNPEGQPVIFLHGGPGGGVSAKQRRFFDPAFYRIILFDQRGAGQSKPHAELLENSTWELVADIELIRKHLGIRKWIVFGGSWGSTLALAYAIKNPTKILGMVLRGIFLCRKKEIDWFYQEGCSNIYPDAWEGYLAPIPEEERGDMVSAYHKRLTGEDEAVKLEAALAWSKWEASTSKLIPSEDLIHTFEDPHLAVAFARIECHYFMNKAFFETDNYLLENVDAIRQIPCFIIQGRYDVVCPATSAWELSRAWPEAQLHIVPDAGHSVWEPGILTAAIEACEAFKELPKDI